MRHPGLTESCIRRQGATPTSAFLLQPAAAISRRHPTDVTNLDAEAANGQAAMKTTYPPASERIVQAMCFLASTQNKNNEGPPTL